MMGRIMSMSQSEITVRPIGGDHNIEIEPATWENVKYSLDSESGEIKEEIQGTFTQYPLRLAWAITIHKSQGLTFEKAIIDAAASFAHGQTYVALSRCKRLEGMVLERPLTASAIINDNSVASFTADHCGTVPTADHIAMLKQRYFTDCLDKMLGMEPLNRAFDALHRVLAEHLHSTYPILCSRYSECSAMLHDTLTNVADSFARQYHSLPADDTYIIYMQQRIPKACIYFLQQLQPLTELMESTPATADNKAVTALLQTARNELHDLLFIKTTLLRQFQDEPFTTAAFTRAKAQSLLALESGDEVNTPKKGKTATTAYAEGDITNPTLYQHLCQWRTDLAAQQHRPAYTIFSNRTLIAIANHTPHTPKELLAIPGIGKGKLQHYGEAILAIISDTGH